VATELRRKIVDPLLRPKGHQDHPVANDGPPRVHWLVTGSLVSGAMWAVLIAVFAAAFGNWDVAGYLVGAAAALIGLLLLAFHRSRPKRRRR
jgi:hypothetical protein